jgi:hypothetical protein
LGISKSDRFAEQAELTTGTVSHVPLHSNLSSQRLGTSSSPMSMFQHTEYMSADGATFNNVTGNQVNTDQFIVHTNTPGAIQSYSCAVTVHTDFSMMPDI